MRVTTWFVSVLLGLGWAGGAWAGEPVEEGVEDALEDEIDEKDGTKQPLVNIDLGRYTPHRAERVERIEQHRRTLDDLEKAIAAELSTLGAAHQAALKAREDAGGGPDSGQFEAWPGRIKGMIDAYQSLDESVDQLWDILSCGPEGGADGLNCYPIDRLDDLGDQVRKALAQAELLRQDADRLSSFPRRRARQLTGPGSALLSELEAYGKTLDANRGALADADVLARVTRAADGQVPRSEADVKALWPKWDAKAAPAVQDLGEKHLWTIAGHVLAATRWAELAGSAEQIDDGARNIERLLRALSPPEVDCWALQDAAAYEDRYVIVFDEATSTLHEPPRYKRNGLPSDRVRDLYAGQEVVLCIAGEDLSNRYVVTRGSASVGESAVLDALSFASSASLRTGAGSVEIPKEDACGTGAAGSKEALDAAACAGILKQARELDQMVELVATARDALARRLVGDSSRTMLREVIEPLGAAATPICVGPEGAEDVFSVYRRVASADETAIASAQAQDAVFDLDGAVGCAERLPASALLGGETFSWNDGAWIYDTFDGVPATADGKTSAARAVRDQVQGALEKAVEEYDKAVALALNYRKHALRRTVLFNLGPFNENTLVSATLQRNTITFHYGDDGRTLLQQTSATSFAVTRTARDSTHWGVQPGYLLSGLPRRDYELVAGSATGALNELRLQQEDLFHAPALFVNFYMCPQNLTLPLYRRECTGGAHNDALRFLPSFAVGVPVSPDIVDGNVFVGLGLPYIPYVTIVTGAHLGLVDTAPASALDVGTSATALDGVTYKQLGVAPFVSINASAEILGLLFPQLKPAN